MEPAQKRISSKRLDSFFALMALGLIVAAWFAGFFRTEADLQPFLKLALPEAGYLELAAGGTYAAWKDKSRDRLLGYVAVGMAHGYGGKLKLAVAVSSDGDILNLVVVEHKETASFFFRVQRSGFFNALKGKSYSDLFVPGRDIDGVTGATYSTRALAEAVRKASRTVSSKNLGFSSIPEVSPEIKFGFPEVFLIILFAFGILGRTKRFKYKKTARWISMLAGLFVLGFLYNRPLTLVFINKMLLGFWPQWQFFLYWYLLIAGILFVYTMDNKNPYCDWFCPFGAAQECLGIVGGAKVRIPEKPHTVLRWVQRVLALILILIALYSRNPSIFSYEVFGAFFHLIGTGFQFALLGIVLVAALFLRRPWCSYLCPLRPVTDYIRLTRKWAHDLLKRS